MASVGRTAASLRRRRRLAAVAASVALGWPLGAFADDQTEFEYGRNRFEREEYDEARDRFQQMLDPALAPCSDVSEGKCRLTDPLFVQNARAYYAACLLQLKDAAGAEQQVDLVLRESLTFQPSQELPQEVLDLFDKRRAALEKELREESIAHQESTAAAQAKENETIAAHLAYVRALEKTASTYEVRDDNSRVVACIPFGVGQFQNGAVGLGVFFAASQVIAGATSIVTAVLHDELVADGEAAGSSRDATALNQDLDNLALANQISFAVWALSTVVGIAEAQVFFEPGEVRVKRRKLPPRPEPPKGLTPKVAVGDGYGVVGVGGTF
jgi:hypothetical protein